jgi:hypothetical protein
VSSWSATDSGRSSGRTLDPSKSVSSVVVVGYGLRDGPIPPLAAAVGAVGVVAGTLLLGLSEEDASV